MDHEGAGRRVRAAGTFAPLILVLALAVALAWLALDSARRRRQAALRTVRDYADFAAFIVARSAQQELERRLLYAFGPLRGWDAASGQPLPPPSVLGRDRGEAGRCRASGVTDPSFIRLDLRTGELTVEGTPLPGPEAAWLADTLALEAREVFRPDWSFAHVFADPRGLGLLAYTVLASDSTEPLALYAKSTCLAIDTLSLFSIAARSVTALPPSLTGHQPNDSLFAVHVEDPHGHVILERGIRRDSAVTGSTGPLEQLGGAILTVELRPDVAEHLVVGGIPYGGAPLAGLLLLLILVSATLAVVQLRRQHALMRARETFISNVSHELRTPLQQILVFTELLRMEKLRSAVERRHSLEVVERETKRLIHLVDNVLRFSRGARKADVLSTEAVALGPLVEETIRAFDPLARAERTAIRLVNDPDGPVTGSDGNDMVAAADPGAIRRVLLNLLDNAVKYGPAGQTVTVRLAVDGDRVRLAVDDQGPGIPIAERDRVWVPFHRLRNEDGRAIAGSGVGLSIVHDLVTRMGGTVQVETAPGGGARFVVTLPGGVGH